MRNKVLLIAITTLFMAGVAGLMKPTSAIAARPSFSADESPQPNVTLAGLTWNGSLKDALVIAKAENKPVLHLQMFGKLDDAYC